MQEIHPNRLWIGHALDIRNPKHLFDMKISAVVDLACEEPPAQLPRQLIYCRFPINDGGDNDPVILEHAVQSIVDLLSSHTRTIVTCGVGRSRSPIFAAAALACHLRKSPEAVLQQIANVSTLECCPQLWNDVVNVFPRVNSRLRNRPGE